MSSPSLPRQSPTIDPQARPRSGNVNMGNAPSSVMDSLVEGSNCTCRGTRGDGRVPKGCLAVAMSLSRCACVSVGVAADRRAVNS